LDGSEIRGSSLDNARRCTGIVLEYAGLEHERDLHDGLRKNLSMGLEKPNDFEKANTSYLHGAERPMVEIGI